MVEVTQNDEDSSTFWTQSILNGYFDVVECDESGTSSRRVAGLNGLRLNAFAALDEYDSEPARGLTSNSEAEILSDRSRGFKSANNSLIRECSVRDPFLCPVDNPMFPVLRFYGLGFQPCDVAASKRFGYSEANEFLARKDLRNDFIFHCLRTEVEDRREPNDSPSLKTVSVTTGAGVT